MSKNQINRETLVQVGLDRLAVLRETDAGVETDAGLVPWSKVDGFWTWNRATRSMMFVPVG